LATSCNHASAAPEPRVDSTAGLERWQTHVQHVLVARNGFPHGYFLPTPGPGALYALAVEPIVSVAANNDVTGLIRRQCSRVRIV